jgi:hypothetical protein
LVRESPISGLLPTPDRATANGQKYYRGNKKVESNKKRSSIFENFGDSKSSREEGEEGEVAHLHCLVSPLTISLSLSFFDNEPIKILLGRELTHDRDGEDVYEEAYKRSNY